MMKKKFRGSLPTSVSILNDPAYKKDEDAEEKIEENNSEEEEVVQSFLRL